MSQPCRLQSSRTCLDLSSKLATRQSCRPAVRRKCTHPSGILPFGGASSPGQTVDASGIEFLRSSDYGHYVSGSTDIVLCQVKTRDCPGTIEMETLRAFPAPANCRKLLHRWRDRQRTPDVREVSHA